MVQNTIADFDSPKLYLLCSLFWMYWSEKMELDNWPQGRRKMEHVVELRPKTLTCSVYGLKFPSRSGQQPWFLVLFVSIVPLVVAEHHIQVASHRLLYGRFIGLYSLYRFHIGFHMCTRSYGSSPETGCKCPDDISLMGYCLRCKPKLFYAEHIFSLNITAKRQLLHVPESTYYSSFSATHCADAILLILLVSSLPGTHHHTWVLHIGSEHADA